MKNFSKYMMAAALGCMALTAGAQKQDWGDFKLWIDPGHSGHENTGLYNYTEAQKVLRVGLATRAFLFEYTTADENTIQMTRDDDQDNVSLDERSDMANAWGADFFYSIHSDAGSGRNTTVTLFGGWKDNGEYVEKTPHGGKAYGDILCPNLTSVMYETGTRGNYYDRVFYNGDVDTHENKYPYLSVNRRTNMASLLSEGGFHTHPVQQALNMNEDYKRLEAFGTYRSIMKYRNLDMPETVVLAGIVSNSETGQGLDAATVTVSSEGETVATYTTDSFESLFSQYVRNASIVHNGFFMFEGLDPEKTYTLSYHCDGFEDATAEITLNHDFQGLSGDNVTWGNISLVNTRPAIISSNSVVNPDAVNTRNDIVFVFSRNMDRESVERSFSITNGGQVTLAWDNDYTLRINISQLAEDMLYTIYFDGTIAKNSQTGQFLDGDGDGTEGGNYEFTFITLPADTEAPYITSVSPNENSTSNYTYRPVIRVEYNEELDWNEDLGANAIEVSDKDGKIYEGRLTHEVVRDASVLHFYLNEDLPMDYCILVKVQGGFADLAGNLSSSMQWKFLTEYRTVNTSTLLVEPFDQGEWYTPGGSGSSKGFTDMADQTMDKSSLSPSADIDGSFHVHYEFDPETSEPWWGLRIYCRKTDGESYPTSKTKLKNSVLQAWFYGDGSNNYVGHGIRWRNDAASVKRYTKTQMHRGWEMTVWDVNNEECEIVSGEKTLVDDAQWRYDAFWLWKGRLEEFEDEDPDNPYQAWTGDFYFTDLRRVLYNTEEQTASLDDIIVSSVNDLQADSNVAITNADGLIRISAPQAISAVDVYALNGVRVLTARPAGDRATLNAQALTPGVYVVKAVTDGKATASRIVIK